MDEVREVANKLEARESCIPRRGPKHTKTLYISNSNHASQNTIPDSKSSVTHPEQISPLNDYKDGAKMFRINGISTSTLKAIINAVNARNYGKI